jgi:hypothetical protein
LQRSAQTPQRKPAMKVDDSALKATDLEVAYCVDLQRNVEAPRRHGAIG